MKLKNLGFKYNMNDLEAAIGRVQLKNYLSLIIQELNF